MTSGWWFAVGVFSGSCWTLAIIGLRRMRLTLPDFGPRNIRVTITSPGSRKISVIKEIRAHTGFGLADAKAASEGTPFVVEKLGINTFVSRLQDAGATVETRPTRELR